MTFEEFAHRRVKSGVSKAGDVRQMRVAWNAAIEAAAKVSESKMTCGCGRFDCYTDNIPAGIANDIRALRSGEEG